MANPDVKGFQAGWALAWPNRGRGQDNQGDDGVKAGILGTGNRLTPAPSLRVRTLLR